MALTHRERIAACLKDDGSLDRPPVALWRHFPVDDQNPESLAQSTLAFQQNYDFDLVKVTPASSFCIKDWGVVDRWEGHPEGIRQYVHRAIQSPKDWEALPLLNPKKAVHLSAMLDCLRIIKKSLDRETPLLQTVFNPLSQAKNLIGGSELLVHLRLYPESVLKGLAIIAESTNRFIESAVEIGIDGIFYAIQHSQADLLTHSEYQQFGLPFDRQSTIAVQGLWCNMVHLHGMNINFDLARVLSHLFPIANWHDRETHPPLSTASSLFNGVMCGGVSQLTISMLDEAHVRKEARDAISQTLGRRLILGTGCVIPVVTPWGNIKALRQSVEQINE